MDNFLVPLLLINSSTSIVSPQSVHSYDALALRNDASDTHDYIFTEDFLLISVETVHASGTYYSDNSKHVCYAYLDGVKIYSANGDNKFYIANVKKNSVLKMYWQSTLWNPVLTINAYQ